MTRNYFKIFLIVLSILTLLNCSNAVTNSQYENQVTGFDVTTDTKQIIKFKTKDAKALAVTELTSENQNNIIKIRENGTTDSFMEVPSDLILSPICEIAKSHSESSGVTYILFNETVSVPSSVEYSYKDEKGNVLTAGVPENFKIGQLLCVFEDGTYDDVLYDSKNNSWKDIDIKADGKNNLVFDKLGHVYFTVINSSNSNMIYRYSPFEKSIAKITPAINGTIYTDIDVSDDGKWLFATTNTEKNFETSNVLRAIKLSNRENYSTLFEINDKLSWAYCNLLNCIYCISDGALYQYPCENGAFNQSAKKEIINGNLKTFDYKDALFSQTGSEVKYTLLDANTIDFFYYFSNSKADSVNTKNLTAYLFDKAWLSLKKTDLQKVKRTYINEEGKKYDAEYYPNLSERYDIRFDAFKNVKGFEELAEKTKGLKNEDVISALLKNNLLKIFAELLGSERYSKKTDFESNHYYENNFFADVLYKKGTDKKITLDEFSITKNKFFSTPGLEQSDIFNKEKSDKKIMTWKAELTKKENGIITVDPEKVLKTLTSYCSTPDIDFSLKAFKGIPEYSELYTELSNEDAVLFLDSSEKISSFCNFMDKTSDDLNKNSNILSLTCFKKNTTEPAYVYNKLTSTINWRNVSDLKSFRKRLYAVERKDSPSSLLSKNSQKLIEVFDENGELSCKYVESVKNFDIDSAIFSDNGFYFESSISKGSDSLSSHGQQLKFYDVQTDSVMELFKNVAAKNNLEIVSFSENRNTVYYSGLNGHEVINGKINTQSLDARIFNINKKLVKIVVL